MYIVARITRNKQFVADLLCNTIKPETAQRDAEAWLRNEGWPVSEYGIELRPLTVPRGGWRKPVEI